MVIAFPLDREAPLSVLGRDDAKLVRQSGINCDVACLDVTGRPFVTTIPIYRLRLAKRAGAGQAAKPSDMPPRGEDAPCKRAGAGMVIAFPLDREAPLSVLGRDDAKLVRQSGINCDVACLDVTGRPFVTTIPIYRLRLAKRAGAGQAAKPSDMPPRGEDAPFFAAAVEAMGGKDGDLTPCA